MSSTSFTNGVTLTDASWFNDVDVATYSVLGDGTTPPATAVAAMKNLFKKGANIASAGTTNLSSATGNYIHITGTTTITAFGTVNAGVPFWLVFDGALTLTHNGTSLILPGAANIVTAANDMAVFMSEGSGNWRCLEYKRAAAFSTMPPGVILPYAGSSLPAGNLACDGSAVSRTTYANLFTAIGTTWGAGDGSTTFNVPNFGGRIPIGSGTGTTTEACTASSSNGFTVVSNPSKWLTDQPVILSNLTGFTTSATAGPTYYVVRISATNIRLATTLALAQAGTPDVTISGTGTVTITYTHTARTLGQVGGEEAHAMTSTELLATTVTGGSHSHVISSIYDNGPGAANSEQFTTTGSGRAQTTRSTQASGSLTMNAFGGNAAMNIMQPFGVVNYMISY